MQIYLAKHNGGVLAIIHPDFFKFSESTQLFELSQVVDILNVFALCCHSSFALLDYGYSKATARYPYNEKRYKQDFFANIRQAQTIPVIGISTDFLHDAFREAITKVEERYFEREIYILSPEPLPEEELISANGKIFLNMIPFTTNEAFLQKVRKMEQSTKHNEPQFTDSQTYCPIPEKILECHLARVVAKDDNGFARGNYNHLYSFLPEFNLLINYKFTREIQKSSRDLSCLRPVVFGQRFIHEKQIIYHAYQVSHRVENGTIWRKIKTSGLDFSRQEPANEKEFFSIQKDMILQIRPDVLKGKSENELVKLYTRW